MAVFRVERNTGYTVMSNHHLRNKELSLKAKGLLSQMLSLPEDWDYTLAGLSYINRESIDAIRTAVWELEKAGYITRRQGRDEKGKMTAIEYTIYEQPQPSELDCPVLENPTQLNKDISRTNLPKKEKSNTDLSITHSIPIHSLNPLPYGEDEAAEPPERKRTERNDAYRVYEEIIKDNIDYDILLQDRSLDRDRLNEIVDLMRKRARWPTYRLPRPFFFCAHLSALCFFFPFRLTFHFQNTVDILLDNVVFLDLLFQLPIVGIQGFFLLLKCCVLCLQGGKAW